MRPSQDSCVLSCRIPIENGFYQVVVRFGFMEEPNIPRALSGLNAPEMCFDPEQSPYFVNRTRAIPTDLPGMDPWREHL
jgi:KUP system potassium uptake protein